LDNNLLSVAKSEYSVLVVLQIMEDVGKINKCASLGEIVTIGGRRHMHHFHPTNCKIIVEESTSDNY
jgi:hypothetical protein